MLEALHQLISKNAVKNRTSRVFQPTIFGLKTQQQMETYTRSKQTKPTPQDGKIQRRIFPHANTGTVQEISEIAYPGPAVPVQSPPTAPLEFTVIAKEVKLMALHKGIMIHQYLGDWLARARSHQTCLRHTQELVRLCRNLGWLVNLEKSELDPKQVFDFVGYQFELQSGRVRANQEIW